VTQDSTVDRVTIELRRSILAGVLPPGKPFSITDISEQLGVSHIPVREALRRLEGQGLVQLRAGRSAIVTPVDVEDLHSVYRLRRLIEADIAGRSIKKLAPADFEQMTRAIEIYYAVQPQPDEVLAHHHEFHLALLRPAATEWDMRILELLWNTSERYVRLVFANMLLDRERAKRLGHSHQDIIEAARAGSADGLRRVIREHLDANEATILAAIADIAAP
jgi:DNA-binding GntR family transcriptional regulator